MKTILRASYGLLAAGLLCVASSALARPFAEIQTAASVNVVTTATSPPHGFKNPASDRLEGIMVDLARAVAKHLAVEIKLAEVPFSGLIATLTSGRADIVSAPLFITEARAQVIDFSIPVYGWGEGVVVNMSDTHDYPDFASMQGQRIGVLVDSVQFNMVKDMPGTKVSTYPDYAGLLADVRAGRIDLGVIDPPSVLYQIQSHNIPDVRLYPKYQPQNAWQVGMAVEKGNQALLDAVNAALDTMKRNGELQAIGRKWGVSNLMSH